MRRTLRFLVLTALVAVTVSLGALAGQEIPAAANDEESAVYTLSNATDGNAVLVFHRAEDGTLTPGDSVPTDGVGSDGSLGNQGAVALSEDHSWLLAVNAGSNDISVFQVEDGGLTLTDLAPSGGTEPISITIYKELVYVLNDGGLTETLPISVGSNLTPMAN
jgi:6-phosphogluconolactonase